MQTTTIESVGRAAAYANHERLIAKGFSLSHRDVAWIKRYSEMMSVSESQVLRGVLARAREIAESETEQQEMRA